MRPSLCTALLLLSPVAALAAPATSVDFSHDDWTIACDNTRTCRAAGYQADDSDPPVSVLLTRKAGAGQAVTAAAAGQAGAISAARSPLMVAMTAAGSLSRLAGTDQAPTEG